MKDLAMWVCELGGYWGWLSSSRFFFKKLSLTQSKRENPSHFESHPTSKFLS
jgi:hypothetical protein